MEAAAFSEAYSEWLEKNQEHLIKSDWAPIAKSYPYYQATSGDSKFTPFNKKLKFCRVCLVSGAGLYLRERHEPFKVSELDGDFSVRHIPKRIFPDDVESCHEYTPARFINQDISVMMPLEHFRHFETEEVIGELCDMNLSVYDFAPNAERVVAEMASKVVDELIKDEIDVAFFFPVSELGHQTLALVQAATEKKGIATLMFATNPKMVEITRPVRAIISDFPDGAPLGEPSNAKMQRMVLEKGLDALSSIKQAGSVVPTGLSWQDPYV